MLNGQCPRCGNSDVYFSDSGAGIQRDATSSLRTGGGMFDGTLPIKVRDYVCTDCGFWESFVNDRDILDKIGELGRSGQIWTKAG
jgi:hypothetical protein